MKHENKFEFLEHSADIKFRAHGNTIDEAFENSAAAFSYYISSGKKVIPDKKIKIELKSESKETLLYQFLDELIYLMDAENFSVSTAKVKISNDSRLIAVLSGSNIKKYVFKNVKAATYAEMHIKEIKNKKGKSIWEVQAVLDV